MHVCSGVVLWAIELYMSTLMCADAAKLAFVGVPQQGRFVYAI
jgi:hypothetical protein